MRRFTEVGIYRCGLCLRSVDAATINRARDAWLPLIICERCVRDAQERPDHREIAATVAVAS